MQLPLIHPKMWPTEHSAMLCLQRSSAPQSVAGPSSLILKVPALGQAPCHSVAAQLREGTTLETVACAPSTSQSSADARGSVCDPACRHATPLQPSRRPLSSCHAAPQRQGFACCNQIMGIGHGVSHDWLAWLSSCPQQPAAPSGRSHWTQRCPGAAERSAPAPLSACGGAPALAH